MTPCVLCAIFYPNIGDILRYVGAICVIFIQAILPCLFYVVVKRRLLQSWKYSAAIGIFISLVAVINLISQFFISSTV